MKKYDQYKNSGVEWLGEIPEHWKIARLKNIIKSKITDGPHTTPEFIENGIPFLSVDGIQDGELVFENCRKISLNDHIKFQKKCKIEKFDILMGKAASIGKIAQAKVDFEFSIWSPLALIKPKLTKINSTFLEYYLKSTLAQYQIEILCTSNTQKNISMDDIPKIISTLPPLSEQEKIAHILDDKTTKIDQAIAIKQKQIELLKERRQILIHKAVTRGLNDNVKFKDVGVEWIGDIPEHWEVKKVKHLVKQSFSGGTPSTDKLNFWDGGIPWASSVDIKTDYLSETTREISLMGLSNSSAKMVPKGAILFVTRSGILQHTFAITISNIEMAINQDIKCLILTNDILSEYFQLIIKGNNSQILVEVRQQAATVESIDMEAFFNLSIPLPEIEVQKDILEFIETATIKIATAISLKEQEIEKLKEYKMSLIDGVVTGKVKVL